VLPLAKKQTFAIQTYNALEVLHKKGDHAQCKVFGDEGHKFQKKVENENNNHYQNLNVLLVFYFFCFQFSLMVLCLTHLLKAHFSIINELFQRNMEV
jgi:hypothetical protein